MGGHAPHGRPPDVIDGKNRDVDENIADVLSQSRIVDGNIADVLTKERSVGEDYFPVTAESRPPHMAVSSIQHL